MLKAATATALMLMSALVCGCFSRNYPVANPNNVYRFYENTPVKVMIQKEDGTWVKAERKIMVPMGYYIGSGIE